MQQWLGAFARLQQPLEHPIARRLERGQDAELAGQRLILYYPALCYPELRTAGWPRLVPARTAPAQHQAAPCAWPASGCYLLCAR